MPRKAKHPLTEEQKVEVQKLLDAGKPYSTISRMLGVRTVSIRGYVYHMNAVAERELREAQPEDCTYPTCRELGIEVLPGDLRQGGVSLVRLRCLEQNNA